MEHNDDADLEVIAEPNSYSVSIVDTPEPAAWSMFPIGMRLIRTKKLKN